MFQTQEAGGGRPVRVQGRRDPGANFSPGKASENEWMGGRLGRGMQPAVD